MITDERKRPLTGELTAEKDAQIEGAKTVIKPLNVIVAIIVFSLCFWRYDIGLMLSIGAAILTYPLMLIGIAFPVGYVLGKRAARRLKLRIRDAGQVTLSSSYETASMNEGHTFILQDGREMSAHDIAKNICLYLIKDEPKEIFNRIWKYIGNKIPVEQQAKFETDFLNKMQLYSEAAALRVFITAKNSDKRYEQLLHEFEKIIFTHGATTTEGVEKLKSMKAAMADIQNQVDNTQLTWARNWFMSIGHDETNPATLMMFIQLFAVNTNQIRQFLQENRPR
jgi:hypothetical protein